MEVVLPPPSRHGRASGMGFTIVGRGPASLDARVCSCMTSAVPEISRCMEQNLMLQGAHLAVTQRLSGQ